MNWASCCCRCVRIGRLLFSQVDDANAAFEIMKEKNVVGSLYRTEELIRALQGFNPLVAPTARSKSTSQYFKRLKFLTEECKDRSDEEIEV